MFKDHAMLAILLWYNVMTIIVIFNPSCGQIEQILVIVMLFQWSTPSRSFWRKASSRLYANPWQTGRAAGPKSSSFTNCLHICIFVLMVVEEGQMRSLLSFYQLQLILFSFFSLLVFMQDAFCGNLLGKNCICTICYACALCFLLVHVSFLSMRQLTWDLALWVAWCDITLKLMDSA